MQGISDEEMQFSKQCAIERMKNEIAKDSRLRKSVDRLREELLNKSQA
jgi:hypothetical protein